MPTINVSFINIVKGGVDKIPEKTALGINIKLQLLDKSESDAELTKEIIKQLKNGEVELVYMGHSREGSRTTIYAVLKFSNIFTTSL